MMGERRTNIELLRIFSIYSIIIFHCAYKSGFSFTSGFSANEFIVKVLWMFGEFGVNLFVLISGYFMIGGVFKLKKLASIAVEVLFYHQATLIFARWLGIYENLGKKQLFLSFFPITTNCYWYVTVYVILYLLSPYLNTFVRSMEKKNFRKFLILLLILFSVIPTVFGLFYNSTETLLFYNRLIWLMIVYLLGAYIRLYGISVIRSRKRALTTGITAFSLLCISILVIERFKDFFVKVGTSEPAYLWGPNSVPMLFSSIGMFGVFLHLKIKETGFIRKIASTTLGIYILHDGILAGWLWLTVFRCAEYQDSPTLAFRILIVGGIILGAGIIIDLLRQAVWRWITRLYGGILSAVSHKNL